MRLFAELFKAGTTSRNCSFKVNVGRLFTSSFLSLALCVIWFFAAQPRLEIRHPMRRCIPSRALAVDVGDVLAGKHLERISSRQ
jgi:hypothetical protein